MSAATGHLSPGSLASQFFSWTTLPCLDSKAFKTNVREQVWEEESLRAILFDRKNVCSGRQEGLFYIANIPALYVQSLKVSEEKVLLFLFWWALANHSCLLPKFLKKILRKPGVYFTATQWVSSQPCIKLEDTSKMLHCNNYWSFTYYSQVLKKKKKRHHCTTWTKYFCQEINGEAELPGFLVAAAGE